MYILILFDEIKIKFRLYKTELNIKIGENKIDSNSKVRKKFNIQIKRI